MGDDFLRHLLFLGFMGLLTCTGTVADASEQSRGRGLEVVTPMTTVPTINPTYPGTTTTPTPAANPLFTPPASTLPDTATPAPPYMTPTVATPAAAASAGQSWCVASPSAPDTSLQVALDYACGYGGADCLAIQQGGSCFNPDTVRDHATYAFNNYYQRNPIPTSCDFGGTAMLTNTDPSTATCRYPSTSTSSSILNTTNPTGPGSTVFGSVPPGAGGAAGATAARLPVVFASSCLLMISLSRPMI